MPGARVVGKEERPTLSIHDLPAVHVSKTDMQSAILNCCREQPNIVCISGHDV